MERKSEIKKIDKMINELGVEKTIEIICEIDYELVC